MEERREAQQGPLCCALSVGFKSGSVLYPLPEGNGYIRFLPVAKKDQPAVISNSLRVSRQAVGAAGEILCVRRVIEAAPLSVIADKQQAVLMCTPGDLPGGILLKLPGAAGL